MIIAVDFDKTLYTGEDAYPTAGEPNTELIDELISRQAAGDKIVLWTCRNGSPVDFAVDWCKKHGLIFDAVNDDIQDVIDKWQDNRSKKITAHLYIDDRAINPMHMWHKITDSDSSLPPQKKTVLFKRNNRLAIGYCYSTEFGTGFMEITSDGGRRILKTPDAWTCIPD